MAIVHQANIAHGPQQVNNATTSATPSSRAQEAENEQSKLLEEHHGERLDVGTAGKSGNRDPILETVGEIDGTADRRRQATGSPKRVHGRQSTDLARSVPVPPRTG